MVLRITRGYFAIQFNKKGISKMNDYKMPAFKVPNLENTDYTTSVFIAQIISFSGWFILAVGVVAILMIYDAGGMAKIALPAAISLVPLGLLLVVSGQTSRAAFDTANYSKKMLEEMQKIRE